MMQITSKLRNDNFSFLIKAEDYSSTPLLRTSELRLHKIFVLNESLIEGGISNLTEIFMKQIVSRLIPFLQ